MSKIRQVTSMPELRYKLTEKMAQFEEGAVNTAEAKVYIGFGTAIVKSIAVEHVINQAKGIIKEIDFISEGEPVKPQLKSEFTSPVKFNSKK